MAGDTDSPSSPPNKRRKTLKSKIEEDPISHEPQEPENSSSQRCPICFLEGGKVIRGEIDCCDHYFCFLCIMEWSKKESRCPLCRRRFTTIRRPPKDGVFARERVVKIPACDHVFMLFQFNCISNLGFVFFELGFSGTVRFSKNLCLKFAAC